MNDRFEARKHRQIDHVTMRVNDAAAADAFYGATLGALGFERRVDAHGRVSFGPGDGHQFGFYLEAGDQFFKRPHVAVAAPS